MGSRVVRIGLRLTLSLALASAIGCVQAGVWQAVYFDVDTGELHCLTVFTDIRAESVKEADAKKELAHLRDTWLKRAEIIPDLPFPMGDLRLFSGHPAWLRIGAHDYYELSLGQPSDLRKTLKAPFDLQEIRVIPGRFFLNSRGNLCVFHTTVYSRTAVDGIIMIADTRLRKLLHELTLEELDRRKNGGLQVAWNDVRLQMIKTIISTSNTPPADPPPQQANRHSPFSCLDDESLGRLIVTATGKSPMISRNGPVLMLTVGLSEGDQRQINVTFDTWRTLLQEEITGGRDPRGEMREAVDFAAHVTMKSETQALNISADWQQIQKRFSSVSAIREKLGSLPTREDPEATRIALRNTAAAIKGV